MLDQDTKRKIDSARQILVGKVPDPKAQVEQITTALIYKFMDDMDKEAQELGGKARFFTNGYEKYAWTKLMDAKLGGHDRLDLYIEAITSLSQNPHIPQLFRDIFKDTFLPYRNPETLSLFLKEVNGFSYEHSEDLGDAFEYLLSVLGSQGDAGQFRTPRHIIDFIVAAVDPKKNETICDPACGTAGFLISAYKNILKQHDGLDDPENKEKPLTPDERKTLMDHFAGYDISPDMVRLSKVNLYLHGFPSPTIFEYDTLSSEEKWDESFDVMLANPPFMSPKGGIKPHKRFAVQANRSEVLFVDYMLEHLRPHGRAGIIVPEGIIFQSTGAYKTLRKMLVEDGLMAVVSLPAGVFNPYAGVKTSILLFDNEVAKKTKNILFLKIENDGYDLGAQRREIDKNDLPLALKIVKKYKQRLKDDKDFEFDESKKQIAHLVAKEKIAETGEYNLSGDRYKEVINFTNQKWPIVELGEVAEVVAGQSPEGKYYNKTGEGTPFYQGKTEFTEMYLGKPRIWTKKITKIAEKGDILMSVRAPVGPVNIVTGKICIGRGLAAVRVNKVDQIFLFSYLKSIGDKIKGNGGAIFDSINKKQIEELKIPLPPLEVQQEIVEQIEVKQNAINHAKAVIQNLEKERRYFGQSLRNLEDVEWVELGEICDLVGGGTPSKPVMEYWTNGKVKWLSAKHINEDNKVVGYDLISDKAVKESATNIIPKGSIIFVTRVSVGKLTLSDDNYAVNQDLTGIIVKSGKIDVAFLFYFLRTQSENIANSAQGLGVKGITRRYLASLKIPLPLLEIQKHLVSEMKEQEIIIEANKKLIGIMERKIADVLSEI